MSQTSVVHLTNQFEGNFERRAWGELVRKVIHDLVRTSMVKTFFFC
jgi:hypothetical protein